VVGCALPVPLRALEPSSLPDRIFIDLLRQIVGGTHAPGTALPSERALTVSLQVNRHVVREALKRLEQVGLVKISQGGATRVLDFRQSAGLDLLALIAEHADALEGVEPLLAAGVELRAGIGTDVVRLAAGRATPAQRAAITAQAQALAAAATPAEVLSADRRFWQLVLDAAGNLAYQLAFNSLIRAVDAIPAFSAGWLAHELAAGDHRRPIASAIAAGDPDAAATVARAALAPPPSLGKLVERVGS
jgi:GntR family transcriptional repressor for pyruvate dehydrogenase complex